MTTYTYHEKLRESKNQDLHTILDRIYASVFPDKSVVRLDYVDSREFQRSGRDIRVVLRKTGGRLGYAEIHETIEEKIRAPGRSCYQDILIEYLSNRQIGTLGWIYTSQADWLSYVKQPIGFVEVFILPMQDLRRWFVLHMNRYSDVESGTALNGAEYNTLNKAVPIRDSYFQYFLRAHGCFYRKIAMNP